MYVLCLENLDIQPGDKVLDVGSGCGYFTILSGYLAGTTGLVHGLDLYDYILEFAKNNIKTFLNDEKGASLDKTFDHVVFIKRNCFLPAVDTMLYDKIHVGACCPDAMIGELYALLVPGGVLVTPYGDRLIKAVKGQDGNMTISTLVEVRYGDLILPSTAEVKEAQKQIEIAKANIMVVPPDQRSMRYATMVNNKICSDLLFEVQGRPIYAHKFVFQIVAPNFYKEIEKESIIKVEKFSSEAFIAMLNFLYVGTFTGGREYWNEILDLAVSYQLYQLQEIVKLKMSNESPPSNIPTFESELSNYVANEKYSDVKFSVEGKLIPAHKFVLVAQSDHFRNMFSGSFKETQDGIIKIYDCNEEVFLEVLGYLYTGQCNITESNCFGILEQANFFQLNRLTAMSEYFWYERLNIENAANVLDFANHFNASQLKQFAVEFIFTHVQEVAKSAAWRELDIDLISSVLIASVERAK